MLGLFAAWCMSNATLEVRLQPQSSSECPWARQRSPTCSLSHINKSVERLGARTTQKHDPPEENRYTPDFHPQHPPSAAPRQHSYCLWWVGVEGGETDECQGAPRHFTFPLLQPDRAWITVNDGPPQPQNHLTRSSTLHLPTLMAPRWVAELPQDAAGREGQAAWGRGGLGAAQAAGWRRVEQSQTSCIRLVHIGTDQLSKPTKSRRWTLVTSSPALLRHSHHHREMVQGPVGAVMAAGTAAAESEHLINSSGTFSSTFLCKDSHHITSVSRCVLWESGASVG